MKEPWILGIASSHNGGACLLHGNRIVVAIQEERLLRRKRAEHPGAFPSLAVEYCFQAAQIRPRDLQAVALCASETFQRPEEDLRLNPQLEIDSSRIEVLTVPHHMGHAIAAYAMAGREEANILIVDGSGSFWQDLPSDEQNAVPAVQRDRAFREFNGRTAGTDSAWQPREVVSMYSANRGVFLPIEKHISLESGETTVGMAPFAGLGNMYAAVGLQIFGDSLDGPGKVMGLAPLGTPTLPIEEFYLTHDWGFEFQTRAIQRFQHNDRWPKRGIEYQNLAASVQLALEEGVLTLCERLKRRVGSSFLCYAGGVALNSVANERIVRESRFDDLFIMPAAEDSGTAIGAAYYALWNVAGYTPTFTQHVDSTGKHYSGEEIDQAIDSFPGIRSNLCGNVVARACELLADEKIIGWFQDGSELGPRSLGQRSILCDPRGHEMKDILNQRVKFRESFRPFAPVILEEDVEEWFDVPAGRTASPFMLRVTPFKAGQASRVPAVVHADGTGRLQTVSATAAPRLAALLKAWKERTGIPLLLNTSFNIAGEPIVETPDDALWCMFYSQIDACVLGDRIVVRSPEAVGLMDCAVLSRIQTCELYGDDNRPDPGMDLPELATASETVISSHVGRLRDLERRFRGRHLRITVDKPWGIVVHGMSAAFLRILQLANGSRSGREIYEIVATGTYTEDQFRRQLALLRRAGAIRFFDNAAVRFGQMHSVSAL